MNIRQISSRPCAQCLKDTRHHAFTCQECGQDTALKPLDPSQLVRIRDRGVSAGISAGINGEPRLQKVTRVSERKQRRIANELSGMRYGQLGRPRSVELTPRERQIALQIATGANYAAIGRDIGITRAGVSSSVKRACERIGAQSVWELIRYVRKQRQQVAA
jgi:DNA-binding CsgD family transcriptional regulator